MLYMVQLTADIERANEIDSKGGPGPVFAYIVERFKPQAIYGTPTRRQIFMVVDLADETTTAELMYVLTWFAGAEPTFTPIMSPEAYGQAIENARKAPTI